MSRVRLRGFGSGAALAPHLVALVPGLPVVGLLVVWAIHNGGYDADTWYWGGLVLLALLAITVLGLGPQLRIDRAPARALALLGAYVAWSYLSITWSQSPGDAWQGSNRALVYLIVFTLMAIVPWTAAGAYTALLAFALSIGGIALTFLARFAGSDRVSSLIIDGRLAAPTGYFNSSVALFTMAGLVAVVMASRRGRRQRDRALHHLPSALLRGLLLTVATACLQLAVAGQSRGWLFTLPLVLIVSLIIVPDRLRVTAAAVLPILGTVAPAHSLINVFNANSPAALADSAAHAGKVSLAICGAVLVAGTLLCWGDCLVELTPPSRRIRQRIGTAAVAVAVLVSIGGGVAATHGDPFGFVKRQWNGFSNPEHGSGGSHFGTIGSGRSDFWRVSLDAFASHPLGGLGQDNFDDYYVSRRRTPEEPQWTHSLEMRLLAHTGLVGFLLFAGFLVAALRPALAVARRGADDLARVAAATALLPLFVWLLHGSVDWFWEIPALSGPALGFLAVALSIRQPAVARAAQPAFVPTRRAGKIRVAGIVAAPVALIAATASLGFPYLAVREISTANTVRAADPGAALSDLSDAGRLNALSAEPGRLGGTIALQNGLFFEARKRFAQAISRERGGWYAWFGEGLAQSSLGNSAQASHDFAVAASINKQQPAIRLALARADTTSPLGPAQALQMLVLAH
jgi:O-Antigen ligase